MEKSRIGNISFNLADIAVSKIALVKPPVSKATLRKCSELAACRPESDETYFLALLTYILQDNLHLMMTGVETEMASEEEIAVFNGYLQPFLNK